MMSFRLLISIGAAALVLATPACAQNATRTRIIVSPSPSTVGFTTVLTAKVDGLLGVAPPAGAVTFLDGAASLGAAGLVPFGAGQELIDGGAFHSCALTSLSGVRCWGSGTSGQLGDGANMDRVTPVNVIGLTSGVVAVAAGGFHSCALTVAGAVKCWGDNTFGQLGGDAGSSSPTPVSVTSLGSGVVAIATGFQHSCALTRGGGVKCWGYNVFGQLGDGGTVNKFAPVDVLGLGSEVAAIAAGAYHACALTSAGGVKCWGFNPSGQLGDGTTMNRLGAISVVGLGAGVVAIAAGGSHSCALTTAGGVKCWGFNGAGQLGDRTIVDRLTPVNVFGLTSGAAAIALDGGHSCALTSAGAVKCFGQNASGELGDGTTTGRTAPVPTLGLANGVVAIAAGGAHSCALLVTGAAKCWGANGSGQIGDGTSTNRLAPAAVLSFTGLLRSQARLRRIFVTPGTRTLRADYPGGALHAASFGVVSHTAQ